MLTRDELAAIASRYDTTMSYAMLRALRMERKPKRGNTRDMSAGRKYRGARKLMRQRYGVRL